MSIQLNKFQEFTLAEMAKGKNHIQVAKELGKSTATLLYHKEKFIKSGLLIVADGHLVRSNLDYEVVEDGKLIGGHWRNQFDSGWLNKSKGVQQ